MTRSELQTSHLESLRTRRWVDGREARGLDSTDPFEGDPLVELAEELADAVNYCEIALEHSTTALGDAHLENLQQTLKEAWEQLQLAVEAEA